MNSRFLNLEYFYKLLADLVAGATLAGIIKWILDLINTIKQDGVKQIIDRIIA